MSAIPKPSRDWLSDPSDDRPKTFKWKLSQDDDARASAVRSREDPRLAAIKARLEARQRMEADLRSETQWRKYQETGLRKIWRSLANEKSKKRLDAWLSENH